MQASPHKVVNRAAMPVVQRAQRPAAAAVPPARVSIPPRSVQLAASLKISSPADSAEREAEQTAQRVMRMPEPGPAAGEILRTPPSMKTSPYVTRLAGHITQREPTIARRAARDPQVATQVATHVATEIDASQSGGAPLPTAVRRFMEPRFGAAFDKVRVHTGERSARLNRQLSARAFTVGNHVFFGRDQFQPESPAGRELIAHELTHTIQQGAAVQRSVDRPGDADATATYGRVMVTQHSEAQVQRLGISDALDYFADKANLIPGFRMFTIVIGRNPINMRRVDRTAANVLRAMVEFMPGGGLVVQALDRYGIFDQVGNWAEGQLRTLGLAADAVRQAIDEFLDSLSWTDIASLGSVWNRAKRIFTDPIDRIISFAAGLVDGIVRFIRNAILRPLAQLARGTRGYDLLMAVLGHDPITGDPVPRTAETLLGGFMKLIGQEEVWNDLRRANAIPRAWAWFQGALVGLTGFVRQIPTMFLAALQRLELADIVLVPRAFAKIATVFGGFAGQFVSWAGQQVLHLLQIIFEVVAPGAMPYIRRAAGAFRMIVQNPIGFVGNLVRAGILGFRQFASRFLTHLRASLIGWLTGTLSGASIYVPQALTLREIIKFVLSVLGLTWQNIRAKLVRVVGESAVGAMETGFDIVMALVTQGPVAAWEKIQEVLSNLREMVFDQIMTFVRERVVQAAIMQLVTSLNPAGAFIQAIIATYNTIMFFVERLRQIAQVAAAFIDSIAAIAGGVLTVAANRVERTMAGLLTLVVSFLARIARLGKVSDAIVKIVNRVRAPFDRALDRVVEWIVNRGRRFLSPVATRVGAVREAIQERALALVNWWSARRAFKTRAGENHTVFFRGEGEHAVLMVATTESTVAAKLSYLNGRLRGHPQESNLRPHYESGVEALKKLNEFQQVIAAVRDPYWRKVKSNELSRQVSNEHQRVASSLQFLFDALGYAEDQFGPQIDLAVGDDIVTKSADPEGLVVQRIRQFNSVGELSFFAFKPPNTSSPRGFQYSKHGSQWEKATKPIFKAFSLSGNVRMVTIDREHLGAKAGGQEPGNTPPNFLFDAWVERGHLVAQQFGGKSYTHRNIVPMTYRANQDYGVGMRAIESVVANDIAKSNAVYEYRAEPVGQIVIASMPEYPPQEILVSPRRLYPNPELGNPSTVPARFTVKNDK